MTNTLKVSETVYVKDNIEQLHLYNDPAGKQKCSKKKKRTSKSSHFRFLHILHTFACYNQTSVIEFNWKGI